MVSLSAPANFHRSGEFPSVWVFDSWAPAFVSAKRKNAKKNCRLPAALPGISQIAVYFEYAIFTNVSSTPFSSFKHTGR